MLHRSIERLRNACAVMYAAVYAAVGAVKDEVLAESSAKGVYERSNRDARIAALLNRERVGREAPQCPCRYICRRRCRRIGRREREVEGQRAS